MPSPKELAKALARQDSVTQQPRNRFLGAIADAAGYVSDQADRYVVPERDPLFGGMRGGDLLPFRNVNRLLDDLSYGGRITTGRGQTTALRPEVVDLAGVTGAMNPIGKAALRNVAEQVQNKTGILGRNVIDPRQQIITYHGSPHTFPPTANNPLGEFSNENIGTGLGGQGYGRGHYVAEAPKVGEGYRNAGANSPEITYMGETYKASSPEGDLLREVHQMGKMNAIRKYPDQTDFIRGVKVNDIKFTGGNLYKVDLPDEHVAKMLEWDKPINEQSPYILEALNKAGINTESSSIAGPMAMGQESHLAKHGITGIRYPDNPSIGTKEGTSNFVVFDPKHMNILERNGVGGAMMQRPKTEFEILHDTAQRNAALPKEQGGLGLPSGNSYMDRAGAMGAVDYLHGTQRLDRLLSGKNLDPKRATSGPMPFGTDTPPVASSYAMNKQDTSRMASNTGDLAESFQVSPKSLGLRGKNPYTVEQSWNLLSPEVKADILDKSRRIGYENPAQGEGAWVLHPTSQGAPFSPSHFDYELKAAKGNPLAALRSAYGESGMLDAYAPSELADIYKLAGYPHEISQANAPWTSAQGVLTGKAMINNPLKTSNVEEIRSTVIPALKEAFKNDRTRLKTSGSDEWAKDARYTPKDWVNQLEQDLAKGDNSYVWTSIPDKVTDQIKKLGYQGIIDTGGKGGDLYGHQVVIPFQPSQVRSRWAAYDPFRRHEADILAGVGVGGMLDPQAIAEALRQQDRK